MAGTSLKSQIDELVGKLNPGSLVGLDIGSHSIKVCELSGSIGKLKLERFAVFNLSEAALIEDEIQKPSEIIEGILEVFQAAGIKSKIVCLGLYGPNTMTKRLNTPEGTKEEVEDHVLWETEQYITFGADDAIIDFHIIGENEGGGKDVIVAAIKNELVDNYSEILKEAKLTANIIDLNVFALSNVFEELVRTELEEYGAGTLLIDMGAQSTKVVVYKRDGPAFTKEIPIGGSSITEEIQKQMGVSYEEAEDLKTSTDGNGNLPEEILEIINAQVDTQVAEIKKNINFYTTQGSVEKVEYCFISGGSSLLPGMVEKLSIAATMPIERFDLFSRIKIDQGKLGYAPEQMNAIAPTVIGLAMRKFSK